MAPKQNPADIDCCYIDHIRLNKSNRTKLLSFMMITFEPLADNASNSIGA